MRHILKRAVPLLALLAASSLGGCYYPYGYGPYGAVYAPPVGVVIGGAGYYHRGYWR